MSETLGAWGASRGCCSASSSHAGAAFRRDLRRFFGAGSPPPWRSAEAGAARRISVFIQSITSLLGILELNKIICSGTGQTIRMHSTANIPRNVGSIVP